MLREDRCLLGQVHIFADKKQITVERKEIFVERTTSEESNPRAAARTVSFGRNWPLAAPPGPGTGPRGEEMAGRSLGTDSQDLATILDPFRAIFVDLGPDRLSATWPIETSET